MRLHPGSTLGPYEILTPLGAGGMGEVYKARDTRLGREVAIKVLPAGRMADEERKRRFVQEARAASALNHPNIVTIYDISQAGGVDFLVMEYVRGKTIDQLIGRTGMRVSEALRCAIQIADALAKAHAAGIVHRDLKPSNVMVNEDGVVKVLDFGLAKLTERGEPGEARTLTAGPTTGDGAIVGTVAYMSPEQAEGKKVNARSDIFSFGAVLYEMVTGRRAFSGDSAASTLAAVLREEPRAPEGVPKELERIILRCLRKDPVRRFQHAADLKVELEEVKEESDSARLAPEGAPPARRSRLWAVAAVLALAVVAAAVWALRPKREAPPPAMTTSPLTTYRGEELHPSFSPDGNQVAFAWNGEKQDNWDIYVKVVGAGTPLRLTTDPAADLFAAWSPDGRQIAFQRGAAIYLISPLGGAERKLVDFDSSTPMSWSPDGRWIAAAQQTTADRPGGVFLIPVQGGENRRITSRALPVQDGGPAFSPDGHRLGFYSCSRTFPCDVYVTELAADFSPKGEARRLTHHGAMINGLVWMSGGEALLYSGAEALMDYRLWRVAASGASQPQTIDSIQQSAEWPAISRQENRLAYSNRTFESDIWEHETGAGSRRLISSTRPESNAQFSPDGKRIAFCSNRSGIFEVWVTNRDGSNPMQLTSSGRYSGTPRWSPDGRRIAYDTQVADGTWDIQVIDSSGGQPRRLVEHPANDVVPSWSSDGKWVYFSSNRTGRPEIFRVAAAGGEPAQVTDQGGGVAFESADGQTLYYTKTTSSGPLFARPLAGGPERQVLDSVFARSFAVAKDGIYYIRVGEDHTYAIHFCGFSTGKSRLVTRIEGRPAQGLTVSPDGRQLLYGLFTHSNRDLVLVENLR